MRKLSAAVLFLGLLAVAVPTLSQEHYADGPIWRVNYLAVKPGKFNDSLKDLREHNNKIWAEAKQQGLILDYKVYLNATSNSPDDWDIATAVLYKNWGALDGLQAKTEAITLKHYGTTEARQQAGAKRVDLWTTTTSALAREIVLK